MPKFLPDVRRWIRHNRNLQGFLPIWPQGSSDPGSPRLVAPWLSDTVQITTPVTPELSSISLTGVAAGAEISRQVDENRTWRLISFDFRLVADANVANRVVRIRLDDRNGNRVWLSQSLLVQTAGQTRQYIVAAFGADFGVAGGSTNNSILAPPGLWMPQSFTLRTATIGLQVGDQYDQIQLFVEVWPG